MNEQRLLEYIANSIWQVPMLAAMAWVLVRLGKPSVQLQHRVWLLTLALSVLLPIARWKAPLGTPSPNRNTTAAAVTAVPTMHGGGGSVPPLNGEFALSSRPQVSLPWWKTPTVPLSQTAVDLVLALYLMLIVWRLGQLAYGWRGAQKLLRNAWPRKLQPAIDATLKQCCAKLRVREPRILTSDEITSPMTIGGIRPAILLPETLDDTIVREMSAILCHELAHVRRRDYVGNWICQLGSLPIAYHPATHGVQQRIRQSRELVCDAMAATAMSSTTDYARCLVTLTQRMLEGAMPVPSVQGVGLFDHDVLEERIMQLLEKKISMSWSAKLMRAAGTVAVTTATIAATMVFHLTPTIVHAEVRTVPPASTVSVTMPVVAQLAAQTVPSAAAADSPKPTTDKDSLPPPPPPAAPPAMDAAPPLPPPTPMTGIHPLPPVAPVPLLPPADAQGPTPPIAPAPPDPDLHAHRHVHPHPHPHAHPHPNPHPHPQPGDPGAFSPQAQTEQFRLTPQQQEHLQAEMARANTQIQQATARLRSPEFKRQMTQMQLQIADATKQMRSAEVQRQMKLLQSPEFKKEMADMQRQVADATKRMQSAEVQKQLKVLQSREFKQQMAQMQLQIADASKRMQSAEVQRQMKMLQSPEFKQQMAEMQRKVQEAAKQLKNNSMRVNGNDVNPNSSPQKSQPETTTPAPQ